MTQQIKHNNQVYSSVSIPTDQEFLQQWHRWVDGKVRKHFKHNKERAEDTAQNVRLRLLKKNFIGRWFFKHLSEELVDKRQAEKMIGVGEGKLTFISSIKPVLGERKNQDSLWRISDLFEYASFDFDSYFYSPQDHTIDSDKVLELIGYPKGEYGILESLYRQGRLRPSELTEHLCSYNKNCPECASGRAALKKKGVSLVHRWSDPSLAGVVSKLRWNDSQLVPLLRNWNKRNRIFCVPRHIIRPVERNGKPHGIDAGLLKYAAILIRNEVINDFKRMSRTDDLARGIFNDGKSSELMNSEVVAYESSGEDGDDMQQVLKDTGAQDKFSDFEHNSDIISLLEERSLTEEERDVIVQVDLMERTIREYAEAVGKPVPRVHRIRNLALSKLGENKFTGEAMLYYIDQVCEKYSCSQEELFGKSLFGPCVRARTELFSTLHKKGMSVESISDELDQSVERVKAALARSQSQGLVC